MDTIRKRKLGSDNAAEPTKKRLKLVSKVGLGHIAVPVGTTNDEKINQTEAGAELGENDAPRITIDMDTQNNQQKRRINKLVPPRPFPTVPTSVSATGSRSSHKEGKNFICLTRKTPLAAYMRRCKEVIIKDGYKTLHLSAMGAAIPLLLQLSCALPPILPFSLAEIHTQVTTGTVEVQDEILPDDDDDDITYQTRAKSTLLVIIKIGDGEFEGNFSGPPKRNSKNGGKNGPHRGGNSNPKGRKGRQQEGAKPSVILQEPEQDLTDML